MVRADVHKHVLLIPLVSLGPLALMLAWLIGPQIVLERVAHEQLGWRVVLYYASALTGAVVLLYLLLAPYRILRKLFYLVWLGAWSIGLGTWLQRTIGGPSLQFGPLVAIGAVMNAMIVILVGVLYSVFVLANLQGVGPQSPSACVRAAGIRFVA